MKDLLNRLKPVDINNFKLKTRHIINNNEFENLVGKNIHFIWKNWKDKTRMMLPGKVLGYKNKKLKIFTYNIMFDEEFTDEKNNNMVEIIPIDSIEEYMVFNNYTKDFWDLTEIIECDENDYPIEKIYNIENIFNASVDCIINMIDSVTMVFTYKSLTGETTELEYPLYFIKRISIKNVD